VIGKLLIFVLKTYQSVVSPIFGNCCRFYPCCSSYCIAAVEEYGPMKGLWLGILRICKCHPACPGGVDFVPKSNASRLGQT